jgi:hypothetical protein
MELETLKKWTLWIARLIALVIVIAWTIAQTPLGRDDTDSGSWGGGRSGMKVMTDALTGCQYLTVPGGGITPRLEGYGQHVGCRK